jgi:hypothetical protein
VSTALLPAPGTTGLVAEAPLLPMVPIVRTWKTGGFAPATQATLVPSRDNTGEVLIAPPVLYAHLTEGPVPEQNPVPPGSV